MNRKSIGFLLFFLTFWTSGAWSQVLNRKPIRAFGHARSTATASDPLAADTAAPNLVEGRELFAPQGIALDTSVNPPILYVSDTGNNRVLAWRNAAGFLNGEQASLVIGQKDRFSTAALGPGTTFSTGLSAPTGLAVDRSGNLFVADSANNRILRYRRPFDQPSGSVTPENVIGQATFNAEAPNAGGISEKTLAFNLGSASTLFRIGLTFDNSGNLLVTDPGNQRVLRFPAGSLAQNQPSADLVLGQQSFAGRAGTTNRLEKTLMNQPSSMAVDPNGRVFVADSNNRVLVFAAPLSNGVAAARIMGVVQQVTGQPPPPVISASTLGARVNNQNLPPEGVFMVGNRPAVIDTPFHRILIYDPVEQWAPESTAFSPPARSVIGQDSFTAGMRHRGGIEPAANTFLGPTTAVATDSELYVADTGNHRVLALPASPGSFGPAVRVLGQVNFSNNSLNLIEGREFFAAAGMAIDTSVRPHRLYVADTGNNRVLGYSDYLRYKTGDRADVVIGQPDFLTARINHSNNDATLPTDSGLNGPQGLAVDSAGNLWVADSGNGRVLRFPKPFEQTAGAVRADLVLGQSSFTSQIRDPGQRSMRFPTGLAFSVEGSDVSHDRGVLAVADSGLNRVLVFAKPFTSGMAASRVFGQPDFTSSAAGADNNRMNGPRHVAIDTDDRLYVADTLNSRVLIFDRFPAQPDQPNPAVVLRNTTTLTGRLSRPFSVTVSSVNGGIWVADNAANVVYRYPRFDQLAVSNFLANFSLVSGGPLSVLSDPFTNLLVSDGFNRIGYFVPQVDVMNAATYFRQAFAPGTIVAVRPFEPVVFGTDTLARDFNELSQPIPLPRELSDLQIALRPDPLADPIIMPMFYASAQQINAPLPMSLPESGRVELLVLRPSTGQIFGAADILMATASPGFFTTGSTGSGQIAAINEDGTINSASNPIARGRVIQIFGTGQGFVPNAPPDGELTPGALPSRDKPRVLVNTAFVEPDYSGLAPGLIGVWQLNVRIPDSVPPSATIPIVVDQNSVPTNLNPATGARIVTTIAVKQ